MVLKQGSDMINFFLFFFLFKQLELEVGRLVTKRLVVNKQL